MPITKTFQYLDNIKKNEGMSRDAFFESTKMTHHTFGRIESGWLLDPQDEDSRSSAYNIKAINNIAEWIRTSFGKDKVNQFFNALTNDYLDRYGIQGTVARINILKENVRKDYAVYLDEMLAYAKGTKLSRIIKSMVGNLSQNEAVKKLGFESWENSLYQWMNGIIPSNKNIVKLAENYEQYGKSAADLYRAVILDIERNNQNSVFNRANGLMELIGESDDNYKYIKFLRDRRNNIATPEKAKQILVFAQEKTSKNSVEVQPFGKWLKELQNNSGYSEKDKEFAEALDSNIAYLKTWVREISPTFPDINQAVSIAKYAKDNGYNYQAGIKSYINDLSKSPIAANEKVKKASETFEKNFPEHGEIIKEIALVAKLNRPIKLGFTKS